MGGGGTDYRISKLNRSENRKAFDTLLNLKYSLSGEFYVIQRKVDGRNYSVKFVIYLVWYGHITR